MVLAGTLRVWLDTAVPRQDPTTPVRADAAQLDETTAVP